MPESNAEKSDETLSPSPAGSPDELVKDLDDKLAEDEQKSVVGGKTTGKGSPDPYFQLPT